MNSGLSVSDSLTQNLAHSFNDLGDIALLQLGQIAQFLGSDLFETPLAGLQEAALEEVGLGQLAGAFQIVSAGANAAKIAIPVLEGLESGFQAVDLILGDFESNARAVSDFFNSISKNAKFAGAILVTVADAIDNAIEQLLDTLAAINPAFGATRDAVKGLGLEFKLGRAIFGDYINDLSKLDDTVSQFSAATGAIADGTASARGGLNQAGSAVGDFNEKLSQQKQRAEQVESALKDLAEAGTFFSAYQQASEIFDGFFGSIEDVFNAAKNFENLSNRLQVTSSSARGASEDLEFLSTLSDDLGINFSAASEGFAQFSAAAAQTNLRGEKTKEVFEDVAQATAVMRLSASDTEGVFLALRQSLSGGTVQLEELNQLAERIPGAFQAAAAALNVTTGELRTLISSGKVQSADFIPKFAEQLAATTQSGVVGASQSAEAAVNRFNNSLGDLQVAMGQTWVQIGTPALNIFAEAFEFAAKNEELFSTAIDALLVAAIPRLIAALVSATQAAIAGAGGLTLFKAQLTQTALQVGSYALQAGLAYAATILFYRNLDRIKDSATSTRTAIASLEASLLDIEKASGKSGEAILNALPNKPVPTDFIDGLVFRFNELNAASNRLFGIDENFLAIRTNAEKQLEDLSVAIGDFALDAQAILGKSVEFRIQSRNGGGPLAEIENIDAQLKLLEKRKLDIDPNDAEGIKKLREEEEALLKSRGNAQKQVGAIQSGLNNALAQAEQQLKAIDPTKIGTKNAEELKAQIQAQIDLISKEKSEFDKLAQAGGNTAQKVADEFEKSSKSLDQSFDNQQVAIAESLAKGDITEEQSRQQSLKAEQDYLTDKVALNQEKLAELRAELEKNAKLRAIDPNSAFLNADQEKKYQEQVEQIEMETAQARIQLAQGVVESRQIANEEELENLRVANEQAEALTKKSETDRIAAIKERQLVGELSEREAAEEIEKARKEAIASEVDATKERLAQIRQLKDEGKIDAKEAAQQEQELNQKLGDLNLQRIEQELQAREAAKRKIIEGLEEINAKAEASIQQFRSGEVSGIKSAQLGGDISEDDAAAAIEKVEQEVTRRQIGLLRDRLAQTRKLRQDGTISAKEAADQERQIQSDLASAEERQLDQRLAAQKRARDAALKQIEDANGKARSNLELSQQQRVNAIKLAESQGVVSAEQSAKQIADIAAERTNAEIELVSNQIKEVDRLRQEGVLTQEEAAQRGIDLQLELGSLTEQLIDNEIEQRKSVAEAIKGNIEAEKERIETISQGLDLEKQKLDLVVQSLERSNELLESRASLQQAIADASIAQSESQLKGFDRALEVRKQLDDGVEDPATRKALEAELAALGINSNAKQVDILRQRQAIEDAIASKRLEALQLEQKLEQERNRLEAESAAIRAKQALIEAEITFNKQQQARLQAEQNLVDAQATGDPRKIANAEKLLELSKKAEELAGEQFKSAIADQQVEAEKLANQQAATQVRQQSELQTAFAEDAARNRAQGLELAQSSGGDAGALGEAIAQIKANPALVPQLELPQNRIPQLQLPQLQMPAMDMRGLNGGVENLLKQLVDLAGGPKIGVLQVSSPQPVQDAAAIATDMSRRALNRGGLR